MKLMLRSGLLILLGCAIISSAIRAQQNPTLERTEWTLVSKRISGWGPFYFGMPYSEAKVLLKHICAEIDHRNKTTGERCGIAYDSVVDIFLAHNEPIFGLGKYVTSIELKLPYSKEVYKNLRAELEDRFGTPESFGECDEHKRGVSSNEKYSHCSIRYRTALLQEIEVSTSIFGALSGNQLTDIYVSFQTFEDY